MGTSIVAALRRSPLGLDCSTLELAELARTLEVVDLAAGALLFETGAQADAAYVVLEGELEIRAGNGALLGRSGPGALVGEQALLADSPGKRNAQAGAPELARLLRVEADLFSKLARQSARKQRIEAGSLARTEERLSRSAGPLKRLLDASERRSFSEGEVLFEEGDAADGLHLVLSGRAEVVTDRTGEPVHLCTVYPGSVFGEKATLRDGPRAASVVARHGLTTAFVALDQAQALHEEHPELEAFLASLLRSYTLPSSGTVHQRSVLADQETCIESVYALDDGRELRALRAPSGRYRFALTDSQVAKVLTLAAGTTVSLDAEHRVVGLEDSGRYEDVAGLQTLALDGVPLSVPQRRTLRKAARSASLSAPGALICRCLNLERAALETAIQSGARSAEALRQTTGCGTVCGGCMRKAVPGILADVLPTLPLAGAETTTLAPLPLAEPLPCMPRLIPWLGNFSLSRDPAGFQQRGHARLGPVFGAHLMGVDFVFVDPVAKPELLATVLATPELDGPAAWCTLTGRLLGAELVSQAPVLSIETLPRACFEAVDKLLAERLPAQSPIDVLKLARETVTAALLPLCAAPANTALLSEMVSLLTDLSEDFTAFGALLPVETAAARRRMAAREALTELVGMDSLRVLLAAQRNASLSVLATLLETTQPEMLRAIQSEAEALPQSLEALRGLPLLHLCLREAIRLHGGGGLWRQSQADLVLDGMAIPMGALVGASLSLCNRPPGAQIFRPQAELPLTGAQGQGLFDEGFGTRGPAEQLPEAVALLVLSRLLTQWSWRPLNTPRWRVPIVPGMSQPRESVQAIVF